MTTKKSQDIYIWGNIIVPTVDIDWNRGSKVIHYQIHKNTGMNKYKK